MIVRDARRVAVFVVCGLILEAQQDIGHFAVRRAGVRGANRVLVPELRLARHGIEQRHDVEPGTEQQKVAHRLSSYGKVTIGGGAKPR